MRDLIDQAEQELQSHEQFGFATAPYRPDQAISDLLALLDDRIESEGIQVGLPHSFLHDMWDLCNEGLSHISNRVWLECNLDGRSQGKAKMRELTYHALIDFLEARAGEKQ